MKKAVTNIAVLALLASVSGTIAASKYSGIYIGSSSDHLNLWGAISGGGHFLAVSSGGGGLNSAVNPAKSVVNSSGKLIGASNDGTTIAGTIDTNFVLKGTYKDGAQTGRFTLTRKYL